MSLIQLDLGRTFPALALFQPDGPLHQSLSEVLEAYVCYRPDIGYVQGMSYLAAMLLINLVRRCVEMCGTVNCRHLSL